MAATWPAAEEAEAHREHLQKQRLGWGLFLAL